MALFCVKEFGPAWPDAVGGFFVGHVSKVGVGVIVTMREVVGEAEAGAEGEEAVLFAPGEDCGLRDFL